VDEAVDELLLEIVTPVAIEVTLAVQQELQARLDEVEQLRKEQVERVAMRRDWLCVANLRVDPIIGWWPTPLEPIGIGSYRALQEAQQEYDSTPED